MFKLVESVDKLLEIEETPSKRQERDIIAALIVAINLVAIGIYPIYRMIAVASGFKVDMLYFFLKDTVQNLMGGPVKGSHSNLKFQRKSRNPLGKPPEPISHSNHRGVPAPRPALLEPVYVSTPQLMSAAGPPSESLSTAATGDKYSGFVPTPPTRYSKISAKMVYKVGEESFRV